MMTVPRKRGLFATIAQGVEEKKAAPPRRGKSKRAHDPEGPKARFIAKVEARHGPLHNDGRPYTPETDDALMDDFTAGANLFGLKLILTYRRSPWALWERVRVLVKRVDGVVYRPRQRVSRVGQPHSRADWVVLAMCYSPEGVFGGADDTGHAARLLARTEPEVAELVEEALRRRPRGLLDRGLARRTRGQEIYRRLRDLLDDFRRSLKVVLGD